MDLIRPAFLFLGRHVLRKKAGKDEMENAKIVENTIDVESFRSRLVEDVEVFEDYRARALGEVQFYDWCSDVREDYVGMFYPGILGVFLFRIDTTWDDVDEWVWVIVGNLPQAYITPEDCPNAALALERYIGALEDWVEAAENGDSVLDLIPVNVPATPEWAAELNGRLEFLKERILPLHAEDLSV